MRTDPPKSVPMARAAAPVARATTFPPLDPPGVRVESQGLLAAPKSGLSVTAFQPNCGMVVRPTSTNPCLRSVAVTGPSFSEGSSRVVGEPMRLTEPRIVRLSFSATGRPSTLPSAVPRRCRWALAAASWCPSSGSRF